MSVGTHPNLTLTRGHDRLHSSCTVYSRGLCSRLYLTIFFCSTFWLFCQLSSVKNYAMRRTLCVLWWQWYWMDSSGAHVTVDDFLKSAMNHADFVSKEIANPLCQGCIRQPVCCPAFISLPTKSVWLNLAAAIARVGLITNSAARHQNGFWIICRGAVSYLPLISYHHVRTLRKKIKHCLDSRGLSMVSVFNTVFQFELSTAPFFSTELVQNFVLYWRKSGIF